jgi:hypothetical protein
MEAWRRHDQSMKKEVCEGSLDGYGLLMEGTVRWRNRGTLLPTRVCMACSRPKSTTPATLYLINVNCIASWDSGVTSRTR